MSQKIWIPVLLGCAAVGMQAQNISTVAGSNWMFPTASLPAVQAPLGQIAGVALDQAGNYYIADPSNNLVLKVNAGTLSVVAGNGIAGYSGDNGPATSASLSGPNAVAVDRSGNLYISDCNNSRIRKVNAGGIITTVAGNGTPGYSGDNGAATSASLNHPEGVAVDTSGNLFIADTSNNRVREVNGGGVITTVAGNGTPGFSGDTGPATSASLDAPDGVAVDASGNLFIADFSNSRIRKVTLGIITTVAGNGNAGYSGDNGAATSASLNGPYGIAVDASGDLFIADSLNARIREVNAAGNISTVAGNGIQYFSGDNGPATSASLYSPAGVAVDALGNLFIADTVNQRIRQVIAGGNINTVAGDGGYRFSGDGGPATSALLDLPFAVAVDVSGNLFVADSYNHRIREVAVDGAITTVAGNGVPAYSGDSGPATSASLRYPSGVAVDASGDLYIADSGNNRVRKVTPGGVIATVAGNGTPGFSGDDGPATSASLSNPVGIAVDTSGNLYIADENNNRIRKVTPGGIITTVAGNGNTGYSGDNGPATGASLSAPTGIALDGEGNLYIADGGNNRIRMVNTSAIITTVAGNGIAGYSGDNGPATSAKLSGPLGVAVDALGDLFIADTANQRIRRVLAGTITTVAGDGSPGYSGDNGPATSASLNNPSGLAVDATGDLFVADKNNNRIRKVTGLLAQIATPGPGGTLSSTSATFTWNAVSGAEAYLLDIGTAPGSNDIFSGYVTSTSQVIHLLPCDGRTIYVQISTNINGQWLAPVNYTYTALTGCGKFGAGDFNGDGRPDLLWQNNTTAQVSVNYYGGAGGAAYLGWNWLNSVGAPGWKVVSTGDFDGNGVPDLVWMDTTTRQVSVNYFGGAEGSTYLGWNWLDFAGEPGWTLVAVADMNGDGVPDLIWQNDATTQVVVHYYGGAGGAVYQSWAYLDSVGAPGWHVVAAADFDGNGTPDLVWQNNTTTQVVVHYYGGTGGAVYQGWNWLDNAGAPGWTVVGANDYDGNGTPDLVWQNTTTTQVVVHYYGGNKGATYLGWNWLNSVGASGWTAIVPR